MKKYILGGLGVIGMVAPMIATVSCGSTSTFHIVSKQFQRDIQNKLDTTYTEPLGNLTVGRKLNLTINKAGADQTLKAMSDKLTLSKIIIQEKPKSGGAADWKNVTEGTVVTQNTTYKVSYLVTLPSTSSWEGAANPKGPLEFEGDTDDSVSVNQSINSADFSNLKFDNIKQNNNDFFVKKKTFGDLEIDKTGASWKDKVSITMTNIAIATAGTPVDSGTWTKVQDNEMVEPGKQIRADLVVTPKGSFGWSGESGENIFKSKTIQNAVYDKAQLRLDNMDAGVNIQSRANENIRLFKGWASNSNVEIGMNLSNTALTGATDNDLIAKIERAQYNQSASFTDPTNFLPKAGIYMERPITHADFGSFKYASFKVTYKGILDDGVFNEQRILDTSGLNKNALHLSVKDGNDLVVYVYSWPLYLT